MKITYIIRDNPAGDPVDGQSVTVETVAGDTLATPDTDSNGLATYEQDGSPGPVVAEAVIGSRTLRRDGRSQDQMGTWTPQDGPVFWRTLGVGVIPGYSDPDTAANDMAVSAGTGLQVVVATGATIIDGHVYRCTTNTNRSIDSNSSGSTRYDRIVVRFTREGQTTEGTLVLAVLKGTPGAGDAPSLTRSAATYEYSLAKLRVIDGAASFTSGDLTDERYLPALYQSYAFAMPNSFSGSTASLTNGDLLYVTGGKLTRLAKGTDGQTLSLASGLPVWATPVIADGSVTDAKLASGISALKIANGAVTDAEFQFISGLSGDAQNQINAKAALVHTHTLSAITDVTASATELNYTDGVTSAIQTQLDGKSATTHYTGEIRAGDPFATTNSSTSTYVALLAEDIVLPTGTWTISCGLDALFRNSVGGSGVTVRAELPTVRGAINQDANTAGMIFPVIHQENFTGQTGTVNVKFTFHAHTSGTVTAERWKLTVIATRTA